MAGPKLSFTFQYRSTPTFAQTGGDRLAQLKPDTSSRNQCRYRFRKTGWGLNHRSARGAV